MKVRAANLAAWICLVVMTTLGGCSSSPAPGTFALTAAPSPEATEAPAPTPAGTPTTPPDAAPVELQGKWTAKLSGGELVGLRIGETGYAIERYGTARSGHISVIGNTIEFSGAQGCAGAATWTWAIQGGKLTFTPTEEPDMCPRYEVLKGVTYSRAAG
jgi:hypothetical protein